MKHQQDKNTKLIRTWLQGDVRSNRKTLNTVLREKGLSTHIPMCFPATSSIKCAPNW